MLAGTVKVRVIRTFLVQLRYNYQLLHLCLVSNELVTVCKLFVC